MVGKEVVALHPKSFIEANWMWIDSYLCLRWKTQQTSDSSYTASKESTEKVDWLQLILIVVFTVFIALFMSWYLKSLGYGG